MTHHQRGQRVRSNFSDREGVVVESNSAATLIEFEDEDEEGRFTHKKWLPTKHWTAVSAQASALGREGY